ncbi:MAG: hypothetical protein ACO3N7_02690 [Kiritimatiellia bacterium]
MSEEAENSDASKPEELLSLFGSFDLTPDWAKGNPGVTQSEPESRGRGGRQNGRQSGGRGRDGQRDSGPPRIPKSSRANLQGVRVKPRRDHAASGPRDAQDHQGDSSRDSRGDQFRGRSRPAERAPRVPVHIDFIPEKKRLSKVVKVIRQSNRAYPLKIVAEKFMENPGFISMKYTVKDQGEEATDFYLYVCTANGMVFSDAQSCEQYVLDHGMEATYEATEKEVPPPSGNFICVGRHSRSGRLIGPPNWHGYQARLEALRLEIAEDLPQEVFLRQVEMVHDPEAIEAWKHEVSMQRFYRKKLEKQVAEAGSQEAGAGSQEAGAGGQEAGAGGQEPGAGSQEAGAGGQEAEAEVGEQAAEAAEVSDSPEPSETPEPAVAETGAEAPVDDRPYEWTREQAEADFRAHHLPKLVRKTKRAIMPGYLFPKMTDPGLLSLTRFHLNREHDRPNSIIFALRPAFKHMRLHVFRHHGEMMVSGIPQHPLPAEMKVVDEIRSLLDYVAAHPGCASQEALKAVANQGDEIPAELVSHFRWLVEKGHLIEMHDDTLQIPHAPRPKK